ncbi:MAG: hypothetical protein IT223_07065 [Crocinitomicaceae bacterium]|nr:hypothetical protein [Crocinitomicaceae bacterium]
MSDEKFYNKVRESLAGYAPEVPQSVYSGVRRKLWLSRFLKFDPVRLNVWYLLLMFGGAGILAASNHHSDADAVKASGFESHIDPVLQVSEVSIVTSDDEAIAPASHERKVARGASGAFCGDMNTGTASVNTPAATVFSENENLSKTQQNAESESTDSDNPMTNHSSAKNTAGTISSGTMENHSEGNGKKELNVRVFTPKK